MAKKSWHKVLFNLLTVIPSILNIVRHLVFYIEQEVRLAKRSLIMLLVLLVFAISLTVSIWFCFCAMIFVGLQASLGTLSALAILFASQIILLLIVGLMMARTKENLLFKNTRELFH